jgi:hypothetical protein
MARRILQGLTQIADFLGMQQAVNARRLVLSWISREGLPAKRLAGRWYADEEEVETWWASRGEKVRALAPFKRRARGSS